MSEDMELTQEELDLLDEPIEGIQAGASDQAPVEDKHTDDTSGAVEVDDKQVVEDGIGEELQQRAQAYGIDPQLFGSSEQLGVALDALDRQWVDQVRQYRQAQQQPQQQVQQQQQQQPAMTQPEGQQVPQVPFKLDLDPSEYPQEFVDKMNSVLEQVHQHYSPLQQQVEQLNAYLQQQHQQQMQQMQQREQEMFMGAVESLGHKQLFGDGTPGNLTQQQAQNLQKLYQEAEVLAESYRLRGLPVPEVKTLVSRAEQLAFNDQLKSYQQQTRNARLSKQANQRLGAGRRNASQLGKKQQWDGEEEDNPVLKEAWDRMIAERGER